MDGASCRPNISPSGRRMRRRVGWAGLVVAVAALVYFAWARVAWPWRALVFLPLTMAGFGFFQAARNTCVARAREGTFEHDDFTKTPAAADEVAASRNVAATINRDALLLGLAGALVAMATAVLR